MEIESFCSAHCVSPQLIYRKLKRLSANKSHTYAVNERRELTQIEADRNNTASACCDDLQINGGI